MKLDLLLLLYLKDMERMRDIFRDLESCPSNSSNCLTENNLTTKGDRKMMQNMTQYNINSMQKCYGNIANCYGIEKPLYIHTGFLNFLKVKGINTFTKLV